MKRCLQLLFSVFFVGSSLAADTDYAILVTKETHRDKSWRLVCSALADQHHGQVIVYEHDLAEALTELKKISPRFVALVGRCNEVDGALIQHCHTLLRQLDADPYTDCRWGIITGRTADQAMMIAGKSEPLVIRRTVSGTRIATRMCEEAECFDELVPRGHSLKKSNGKEQEIPLDDNDSIAELVAAFSDPSTQLIITSGHATTRDWQPGFRYKNGSFHSRDGVIHGRDLQGKEHPVQQSGPKVYLPCGNCLMGLIDGPDAMALAWMQSVGVRQMAGYVEPTWYGYMGWGLIDYFVEQPGRFTFAEAFVANQIALVHRLENTADLSAMDRKGLLFDRDRVAFYGDPAWSACMAPQALPFSQKLMQTDDTITLEIQPLEGEKSYEAIDTNGSQRGGRPFIAFLAKRIDPKKWSTDANSQAVLADDFVLLPRPAAGAKALPIRVEWKLRN